MKTTWPVEKFWRNLEWGAATLAVVALGAAIVGILAPESRRIKIPRIVEEDEFTRMMAELDKAPPKLKKPATSPKGVVQGPLPLASPPPPEREVQTNEVVTFVGPPAPSSENRPVALAPRKPELTTEKKHRIEATLFPPLTPADLEAAAQLPSLCEPEGLPDEDPEPPSP